MNRYQERIQKLTKLKTVYPVSCEALAHGRSDRQWLDGVLAGGAGMVQLRDKHSSDRLLLEKALYFRARTREAGALFIINDRVDIALLADADGVHVGQQDLPPAELRRIVPEMLIGISCNSREDVVELARGGGVESNAASYYNIGPLFSTKTKVGLREFLGLEAVADFQSLCSLPFTVMGGIKEQHVADLLALGASRIAVVTAISQADDIMRETRKWMDLITTCDHV